MFKVATPICNFVSKLQLRVGHFKAVFGPFRGCFGAKKRLKKRRKKKAKKKGGGAAILMLLSIILSIFLMLLWSQSYTKQGRGPPTLGHDPELT